MSVENGKVCCNCRHCKRIKKEHGTLIECRCDRDNAYLTTVTVLGYWCRHWAKEVDKTKKSNIKCANCLYADVDKKRNYWCCLQEKPKNYWNRCKQFKWKREVKKYDEDN